MQTYGYRLPAYGKAPGENLAGRLGKLEESLKSSPDCLMSYCMFPSDSDILDRVSLDMEEGMVTAVNLHTYTKLWDGMEDDLKTCVQENLDAAMEGVTLTGEVQALGRGEDVPGTLYHIAQEKDVESILKNGLVPGQGNNGYKSHEDYVYLTDRRDIATWLVVLKNLDSPVILEVDTKGVDNVEPGRHFSDRDFAPPYGEYRTKNPVPASNIKRLDLENGNGQDILISMNCLLVAMKEYIKNGGSDRVEANRGVDRLTAMEAADPSGKAREPLDNTAWDGIEDDSPPWDENDNGTDPDKAWDSEKVGDALTEALGRLPGGDMEQDI